MISFRDKHPWRQRSREFATHLATLPSAARRAVVKAEKSYVAELNDPSSEIASVARDFDQSMFAPSPELVDEDEAVA